MAPSRWLSATETGRATRWVRQRVSAGSIGSGHSPRPMAPPGWMALGLRWRVVGLMRQLGRRESSTWPRPSVAQARPLPLRARASAWWAPPSRLRVAPSVEPEWASRWAAPPKALALDWPTLSAGSSKPASGSTRQTRQWANPQVPRLPVRTESRRASVRQVEPSSTDCSRHVAENERDGYRRAAPTSAGREDSDDISGVEAPVSRAGMRTMKRVPA